MYGKEKGLLDLMNHGLRYWAMCSLLPELNYSGSGNVLEIGCNSGLLSIMLKKQWPQLNVFAVDRDTKQIAMANVLKDLFHVDVTYSVAEGENIGDLYRQGEFDFIYLCEILEHIETIEQQKAILEKAIMVCKPGGNIVVSVPFEDRIPSRGHRTIFNRHKLNSLIRSFAKDIIWLEKVRSEFSLEKHLLLAFTPR